MPTPEQLRDISALLPAAFSEKDRAAKQSGDKLLAAFRDQDLPEKKVEDDLAEVRKRMLEFLAKNP